MIKTPVSISHDKKGSLLTFNQYFMECQVQVSITAQVILGAMPSIPQKNMLRNLEGDFHLP